MRVDKFSDSSIDMYVRCFTKSDSWNEWLSVKEKLAIEIKKIVEKIRHLLHSLVLLFI